MGYSPGCMNCVKFMLFATNFLAWLMGITVFSLAMWIRVDYRFKQYIYVMGFDHYYNVTYLLMTVGFIMFIVGFLGCCGVVLENICIMSSYLILLFIMFILELAAAVYVLANGIEMSQFDADVESALWKMLDQFADDYVRWVIDNLQSHLECCGVNNFDDFDRLKLPIPDSCRSKKTGQQYKLDCRQAFVYYVEDKSILLAGLALGLSLLHMINMAMTTYLCMAYRDTEEDIEE